MQKVLYITNVPVPYRMEFFRQLSQKCELTVMFEADKGKFQYNYDVNSSGFESVFLTDDNGKYSWKKFRKTIKKHYDHVIVSGIGVKLSIVSILYLIFLRRKYIISADGAVKKSDSRLKKMFKRFLVKGAVGFFSTGPDCDEYFLRYGVDKDKIHRYSFSSLMSDDILITPISDENKVEIKAELGINKDKILLLSVGRFIHRKGFDILLKAYAELQDKCYLVIVGGTPTDEYKKMIADEKITEAHFIDFISKEELKKYYMAADIFVLPTREDIWGLVVNEAMAMALPVVTTYNCIAGKTLITDKENGLLVPIEDVKALANAITYIVENKEVRHSMSKKALETIRPYNISNMVDEHMKVFEEQKE